MINWIKSVKKSFSLCQTYRLFFKIRFSKKDRHTGDEWLTHVTKHHKDNELDKIWITPVE